MKRGFPSCWFVQQSSPAGTGGNGDISGFELNKEGFGGSFGKVLVLVLVLILGVGWESCCIPKARVKLPSATGLQL